MRRLKDVSFMFRWTADEAAFLRPTIECHSVPTNPKRLQLQIINTYRNVAEGNSEFIHGDGISFSGLWKQCTNKKKINFK
jgi:hypothetical protein